MAGLYTLLHRDHGYCGGDRGRLVNTTNTTSAEVADLPRGEALPHILREEGREGLIRALGLFDLA